MALMDKNKKKDNKTNNPGNYMDILWFFCYGCPFTVLLKYNVPCMISIKVK